MTEKKANPFDHFNRINSNYDRPSEQDLESFVGWMADTYYSNYQDTVLFAEMSSCLNVPDEIRETLYRAIIPKERRGHFWPKAEKEERVVNLMKKFNISRDLALEHSRILGNAAYHRIFKEPEKPEVTKIK